ncbi:MAG: DUF4214 domain-containing protein [Gemmataceae bacterium]
MARTFVLALPTLLLTVSLAPAQSTTYRPSPAGNPQTLVRSWTEGYLRREPTPAARTWIQSLRTGHSPADVQSGILASDEYFTGAGGTKPAYVRQLYADVIGRAPMPAEINYWLGRLRYDTRKDVVAQMLRYHPRNVSGMRPAPPNYNPDYFPDPVSPAFRDPSGPYFHSPYFYNYEKSRAIRAFYLGAQG